MGFSGIGDLKRFWPESKINVFGFALVAFPSADLGLLISTLEEFRHYIDGLEVYVDTDHQNITWLSRTKGRTDRLGRWILRLSEFRAKIAWRKGKYMDIADCMSRNPQPLDAAEDEDSSNATQSVPQVHMLVTEINPGDAGEALPLRVTGFIGGEAEFAVVPALFMVEFDMRSDCEHELENAEAQQRAQHARGWLLGDEQDPSQEGEVVADFDFERAASSPSREGPSSSARAMASVEDGPAADEAPLVLPESLLPEMVSADHIRREQQRDEFAKELLRRLQESGGPPVSSVCGHSPGDLCVFVGVRGEVPGQGHPKIR